MDAKTLIIIFGVQVAFWLGWWVGSARQRLIYKRNELLKKINQITTTKVLMPKIMFDHPPTEDEIQEAVKKLDALMAQQFPDFERITNELKTGNNPDDWTNHLPDKKLNKDFENSHIFNEIKKLADNEDQKKN